jgi:hypothetical protein
MTDRPLNEEPVASDMPVGPRRHERTPREYNPFRHRPFVPLLLLVLATVTWFAFQCVQLVREKEALATAFANQGKQFEDSAKMRGSLDAIARDTALLAAKGNAGAKLVVDELARRGVTINPTPQLAAPLK